MAVTISHPVIFVPGIMGSALRDEYPVEPETVWSPFKLLIKAYERITPHPSDTRYEVSEPARVTADQVFEIVYAEFIEELRHNLSPQADQPVPVYPFAYDWRKPLENIEAELADFVREVIDRTKLLRHYYDAGYGSKKFPARVNLVAHSMGGLIVTGYLEKHGQARVNKIATIATPFRGSLEAIAKTAVGAAALGVPSGASREREAARVTPSLYYLLPSFKGAIEAEAGLEGDIFLPEAWQPGILETLASFIRMYGIDRTDPAKQAWALLKQMLDSAWKHRLRMEKFALANSKDWLCIVGVNEDTRVQTKIIRDAAGKPRFQLAEAEIRNEWPGADPAARIYTGDNTVPYSGARAKFIPVEQVICLTPGDFGLWEIKDRLMEKTGFHSSLPNMNLAQRLVISHFKGYPYGEVWGRPAPDLGPGQTWDPPIAGLKMR